MKFKIQEYLEISTIHGLVYISKRFHFVERFFWVIALIFSVICTSILIIELIIKIRIFPIVVYVADSSISISEIYFPAITICPQFVPKIEWTYQQQKSFFYRYEKHTIQKYPFKFEEYYAEISDEIKFGNLSYVQLLEELKVGNLKPEKMGQKLLKRLQVIDIITDSNVFYNLNYSVPTDDFLDVLNEFGKEFDQSTDTMKFTWINQKEPYYSEIITPFGLCFSFNLAFNYDLLDLNSTSDDFHYQHVQTHLYNPYIEKSFEHQPLELEMPRKTLNVKAGLNLHIFSMWTHKKNGMIENKFNGYLCFLHDGFELPTKNSEYQVLGLEKNINILIHPQMNDVDDSIAEYEVDERNCYLNDEKVLKFFKVYSKNNCEAECLSDFMLSRCGCVEFYMIRSPSTRICSANEKDCYQKAHEDFLKQKSICGCLQPCTNIKYDFEIIEREFLRNRDPDITTKVDASMRFNSQFFMQFVSKQQFNTLDFLSFAGGILGLFAGFSALSFIELIYWFTVRLFIGNAKRLSNEVHPLNENLQNQRQKFYNFFKNFFEESSIHGLKFIIRFTKIERIIWAFFLVATLTFCFDLCSDAREKVPDSRVIAYDDDIAFNDEIPFPAFTIVPEYLARKMVMNFMIDLYYCKKNTETYRHNKTVFDFYIKKATRRLFCKNEYDSSVHGFKDSTLPYLLGVLKEDSMFDWFRNQSTSFNGKYQPEFAEIRTARGMGFTFGIIAADEMIDFEQVSSIFNYTKNITTQPEHLEKFPKNLKNPLKFRRNIRPTLTLKLVNKKIDSYETCLKASFLVHQPDYLPTFFMREEFYAFESGSKINIEVAPEITKTDKNLRSLSPETRDCYFEGERRLKYFKKYSKENCQTECLTELTFKRLGCFDIDQPFKNESQICKSVRKHINTYDPHIILNELYANGSFTFETNCSCRPSCNFVTYKIKYFVEFEAEQEGGNETTINVIMNMDEIVLFRRFQQFSFSDVVSYVGGLLGLFAGISMLSIVEFFYFFTIRVIIDVWRLMKMRRG